MQDFTGVPAVVDLAAMRDGIKALGGDPEKINPLVPVDLVIDTRSSSTNSARRAVFARNVELDMTQRRALQVPQVGPAGVQELRVRSAGTGICHQVNLEYLADGLDQEEDGETIAYPDTCVGTDSHTTMINGLGVLAGAWAVRSGSRHARQPVSMLLPESSASS